MIRPFALALVTTLAAPLAAKESLGVYSNWAAFRDDAQPRCYAIAKPPGENRAGAFASIGTWPRQNVRSQLHFRLSRSVSGNPRLRLRIDSTNYELTASGRDAWARDNSANAAIIAALRSASTMRVSGPGFSDRYDLSGVATAMDAALLGCANR